MGDVIPLTVVPGDNYQAEADEVLSGAKGKLTEVLVIGFEPDGSFYYSGSHGDQDNFRMVAIMQSVLVKAYTDGAED